MNYDKQVKRPRFKLLDIINKPANILSAKASAIADEGFLPFASRNIRDLGTNSAQGLGRLGRAVDRGLLLPIGEALLGQKYMTPTSLPASPRRIQHGASGSWDMENGAEPEALSVSRPTVAQVNTVSNFQIKTTSQSMNKKSP